MDEKYQARNNGQVDEPEKTKKQEREESSAKVAKVAAKGAAEYFAPGVGGKAVDMISKTEAGQQVLNRAGKTLAKNPITGRMAKKLDDQGMVDAADSAMDMISGDPSKASMNSTQGLNGNKLPSSTSKTNSNNNQLSNKNMSNPTNNKEDLSESNQNEDTKNDNSFFNDLASDSIGNLIFKAVGKKYVIIAALIFFFLVLIMTSIVSAKDFGNLDLTNKAESIIGTGGTRACTTDEIESSLVYVGDSRMLGMQSSLGNSNISYIAESSQGYNWLKDTASLSIDSAIQNNEDSVIVLGLGVNDLYNVDNYISYYNDLKNKYPNNTFYVLSVNPVDESKTINNGYSVTNAEIDSFNKKLKASFSEYYIDSNSSLSSIGSSDGLHYDSDTDKNIHNSVISGINSSGKVACGASSDYAVSLETVAMWYIENVNTYTCNTSGKFQNCRKKYKTPFGSRKFGDDCTEFVSAYMSFISGTDIPESYSAEMVDPNGVWAQEVEKAGWKAYSSDEIGSLQMGDVLIAHSGSLYSTKGQHGEIYINESQTFGWGTIKKSYPTNNTISTTYENGHVHFRDNGHDYITVYRFEG